MTNEKAREVLQEQIDKYGQEYDAEGIEALEMAIEVLGQEPCEDTISRQAVLSKIKEVCFSKEWLQFRVDKGSNGQRDFLIDCIEQLPPATPQPKTGHWRYVDYKNARCSNCNYIQTTKGLDKTMHCNIHKAIYKYCPNCGARMIEPQESEDKE